MSLDSLLHQAPRIGGASIVCRSEADAYFAGSVGDALARVGTADWVMYATLFNRARIEDRNDATALDAFTVSLSGSAANQDDAIIVRNRHAHDQTIYVYVRQGGVGQPFTLNFNDGPAGTYQRVCGAIPVMIAKIGTTLRISGLATKRHDADRAGDPYVLIESEGELTGELDLASLVGDNGVLCFGRSFQNDTSAKEWAMSDFFLGVLRDDVTFDQLGMGTESGRKAFMVDPATGVAATEAAWQARLSFDLLDPSGQRYEKHAPLAAGAKCRCLYTGIELDYTSGGSEEAQALAPYTRPTEYYDHFATPINSPKEVERHGVLVSTTHQTDHSAQGVLYVERRSAYDGRRIAPLIPIPSCAVYEDSSAGDALVHYYGSNNQQVTENHLGAAVAINEARGELTVWEFWHSVITANSPESGDTFYETGWCGTVRGGEVPTVWPIPFDGTTGNHRCLSYGIACVQGGVDYCLSRRSDTQLGYNVLCVKHANGRVSTYPLHASASANDSFTAAIPRALVPIGEHHLLAIADTRIWAYGRDLGYAGSRMVLIDTRHLGGSSGFLFAPRTGDDVSADAATHHVKDSRYYIFGPNLADLIADTFVGEDAVEEELLMGHQVLQHTEGGVHYLGVATFGNDNATRNDNDLTQPMGPYTRANLRVLAFDPEAHTLTLVRTHDLMPTLAALAPGASHLQPLIEDYQAHRADLIVNAGRAAVFALCHDNGEDYSATARAGQGYSDYRAIASSWGTAVSLLTLTDWHTADPILDSWADELAVADFDAAMVKVTRSDSPTRLAFYAVDQGAPFVFTTSNYTGLHPVRRLSIDASPYLETANAMPTATQIAAAVAAEPTIAPAIANLDVAVSTRATTDSVSTAAQAVASLRQYVRSLFRLALRSDVSVATSEADALTEINAGGGDYSPTDDAQKAIAAVAAAKPWANLSLPVSIEKPATGTREVHALVTLYSSTPALVDADADVAVAMTDSNGDTLPTYSAVAVRRGVGEYVITIEVGTAHVVPQTLDVVVTAAVGGVAVRAEGTVNITNRQPGSITITGV